MIAVGASLARTDIQTTMQTRLSGAEAGDQPLSTTTTYSRRNAQRVETTMSLAGSQQRTVTLTLCDKKVTYTLDPGLKIFYATSLASTPAGSKAAQTTARRTTGKMTMTLISLRDKGVRNIGSYKTRCYEITMRTQTSGCLGASDTTIKQEICIASGGAQGAGDEFSCGAASEASGTTDSCTPTVERKGDKVQWALYDNVMRGLRVSTRLAVGGGGEAENATTETRLIKVSRNKLPDSLFVVPQGSRQLSVREFQAAQSKALMQEMMQGADDNEPATAEDNENEE
jgi:hypothetical protein